MARPSSFEVQHGGHVVVGDQLGAGQPVGLPGVRGRARRRWPRLRWRRRRGRRPPPARPFDRRRAERAAPSRRWPGPGPGRSACRRWTAAACGGYPRGGQALLDLGLPPAGGGSVEFGPRPCWSSLTTCATPARHEAGDDVQLLGLRYGRVRPALHRATSGHCGVDGRWPRPASSGGDPSPPRPRPAPWASPCPGPAPAPAMAHPLLAQQPGRLGADLPRRRQESRWSSQDRTKLCDPP